MSIFPQEIAAREFFSAPDGYDKDEVRAYLQVIAREHAALAEALEKAHSDGDFGAVSGEVTSVLSNASQTAAEIRRRAEEEAQQIRERAEQEAQSMRSATEEASDRLREEAERYAFEIRNAADNAAREQQMTTADRVGRLLTGEATIRERLFALETTLQAIRGQLQESVEDLYPELNKIPPPLPTSAGVEDGRPPAPVIDLDEKVIGKTT